MIEFEEYKSKLNDLKPKLEELRAAFVPQSLLDELERLHAMAEAPGFWDDPARSQKAVMRTKTLERKRDKFQSMCSEWDDLMTICEMALEDNDDSMLPELTEGYAQLEQEMEKARLETLLSGEYDNNNAIYVDEEGNIPTQSIEDVKKFIKLGSVLPDANMSWRNDFRWKNLNFGFMVSARLGGVVFSRTQATLDYFGVSEATAAARDRGGVMINGRDMVDANLWYSAIAGGNSLPQFYTYSATNVRLQEASIGYTIPRKWLRNVCEITISVVGRNLWMIYNKAPFDPESIATTGNYYQGIDYFMMPSLRNLGFSVKLTF